MFKGKIIQLKSGIVVVPFRVGVNNDWECVVVQSNNVNYTVGGYNVMILNRELEEGKMMNIGPKRMEIRDGGVGHSY